MHVYVYVCMECVYVCVRMCVRVCMYLEPLEKGHIRTSYYREVVLSKDVEKDVKL